MKIICDIDDVLVNAGAVKRALAQSAVALGVRPQHFWSAYRELRKHGEFSPNALAKALPKQFLSKQKAIAKRYEGVIAQIDRYVYPDSKAFAEWCNKTKQKIVFYTYGEPQTQRKKIKALKRLFYRSTAVITTDRSKRRDIKKAVGGAKSWMWLDDFKSVPVNDRAFRGGTLLYIRRRAAQPVLKGTTIVKNLYQAMKIIG